MNYKDTVASRCRYGECAWAIVGTAEIISEDSEDGYQGHVDLLAKLDDGRFVHLAWTYGSCSGCDEWESRGLSDEAITEEIRRAANYFDTKDEVLKYFHLELKDAHVPIATAPTNGSIPGMMYSGFGGFGEAFQKHANALRKFLGEE